MTTRFDFITLTPAGAPDAALAIAGSRAGALGVLNLEFTSDAGVVTRALDMLATHARGRRLGVLVAADAPDQLALVLTHPLATQLEAVLLGSPELSSGEGQLEALVAAARGDRRLVFGVVTTLEDARAVQAAGADALVAKGNEAGGWVGEETAFVLLQRLLGDAGLKLPIWVQGGVGLHTAAACCIAGAAGAVLDSQLLLARESPLAASVRGRIAAMDGTETVCLGASLGAPLRLYSRPALTPADELRRRHTTLELLDADALSRRADWRRAVRERVDWQSAETGVLAVGQDAAFAAGLARRFQSVGGILTGLRDAIDEYTASARSHPPLAEGAALAEAHGTRYPILQGPMTRVSDRAEFAAAVAEAGALPFLALALMRAPEVRSLLEQARALLADRPWGVGILGFVPPELRAEQLAVVREFKPPFALVAGGRPAQAKILEEDGTSTYLHVPSPGLLELFLSEGATNFIFEGRECGGHVGPRSSFVLWEAMLDVLLKQLPVGAAATRYRVVFAGGIHDERSAAMVAALAAPLVERGCRIGVLLGTAYLFTEEAVTTGAITAGFQRAALACDRTVLLESGPGQATRCAPSAFVDEFEREKRDFVRQNLPPEELRNQLELLNIGRLRIASKGVDRNPRLDLEPHAPKLVPLSEDEQQQRGMYMIGQVAALRDATCTLGELHARVSEGSTAYLRTAAWPHAGVIDAPAAPPPAAIAVVGVSCIVPGAADTRTFWTNIHNKVDAITEVPATRWDWHQYFDADRSARDKVYSRWGGFVDPVPFDAREYGMPPTSLRSIEPFQLLGLTVVRAALEDAGYLDRPFARERTSIMLGAGGGGGDLAAGYVVRSSLPDLFGSSATELTDRLDGVLPEWTEDSFAGLLMNVAAGRAANRFDLGGLNFTVDAACASSLAAVYLAVRDLESRTSDVAIAGGVDAIEGPFAFLCFSKTQALSPTGHCRPFDAQADGIAISEGFGAVVLKRLEDAERDGDRIYAVIQGVGGSSDGRDRSLTAPRPAGQIRALRRAYAQARFSPATVGLIEAHGTGTVVGDMAEVESLTSFFEEAGAPRQGTALGSVKSMIGHAKASAGILGLVKVALALHHKVLPPTLGVTEPNPKVNFPMTPFYVNTEVRPWIKPASAPPRRAGVEAFGFGGTNFHVALEEYTGEYLAPAASTVADWPAELFLWRGRSSAELLQGVSRLLGKLDAGARPRLIDLAYAVDVQARAASAERVLTLAIVATSVDDLRDKLLVAQRSLAAESGKLHDPRGVHYAVHGLAQGGGQVAFLFPGQGSQFVNMARDLAVLLPQVRAVFDRADEALGTDGLPALSSRIFPPPAFDADETRRQADALTETDVAQPALAAASLAYLHVLRSLGVEPDLVAGHSFGEFVALHAAGCFDEATLLRLAEARGRFIRDGLIDGESGAMAAVDAGPDALRPVLADCAVVLANLNAPRQTVLSGSRAAVDDAVRRCTAAGFQARRLPVACAFHSPLVAPAQRALGSLLAATPISVPRLSVYSNTTASAYPSDPGRIIETLAEHLVRPVDFVGEVSAMYTAGARIFVEVGPRSVLSGLTERVLGDEQPHICVPLDGGPNRGGVQALLQGLAILASEGVPLRTEQLFQGRAVRRLDLNRLEEETGLPTYTPTTWLVDGHRARPANEVVHVPKPLRVRVVDETADRPEAGPSPDLNHSTPSHTNGHHTNGHVKQTGTFTPLSPPAVEAATMIHSPATNGILEPGSAAADEHAAARAPAPRPALSTQHAAAPIQYVESEAVAAPLPAGAADVMHQFQGVMQRFLDTQGMVMLAYLGGQRGVAAQALPGAAMLPQPTRMAPPPISPQRALPVDSRTSAPPIAAPVVAAPTPPVVAPPPVPAPQHNGHSAEPPIITYQPPAEPVHRTPSDTTVSAGMSSQQLQDMLLSVVGERTGYPPEMLDLDVDMEADLGIDSIKRVEIAGTLVRSLASELSEAPELERLATSRTLREVLSQLEALTVGASGTFASSGTTGGVESRPFESVPVDAGIDRYTLRSMPAPAARLTGTLAREGVVVLVEDEHGVGHRLAELLGEQGHAVVRLGPGALSSSAAGIEASSDDLRCPESVASLVGTVRARFGPVKALVCLGALRSEGEQVDVASERWHARWLGNVESLFLLIQACQADLAHAAEHGGAAVLAATALGGTFGIDETTDFCPGDAGIAGVLKTLAQEEPGLRVKAVDLPSEAPCRLAEWLHAEIMADDGLVEVGYQHAQRMMLELVPNRLAASAPPSQPLLDNRSIVLITGGARGITAETAAWLAAAYRPTLLLVGRTVVPNEPEPAELARLTEPQALRRAMAEQLRRADPDVKLGQVERLYRQVVAVREVRATIARLEAAGARARYFACDVREPRSFGALLDTVYATYGRIDGVIHGAGVIEDKLIRDKQLASFERVLETKVRSAAVLAAKLRPETLRFLVLFSSVSGRFGNRGQADYAAANETLNKLAQQLDRRWPARVVAINWGPWLTTGMVSQEVQRQFAERGVALIPPEVGCRKLDQEVQLGRKGEAEVVIGGSHPAATPRRAGLALLSVNSTLARGPDGQVEVVRHLDPRQDRYLDDHRIDGRPVMPFAVALELMAEVAAAGWPELEVVEVSEVRLLRGITVPEDGLTIRITARPHAADDIRGAAAGVSVDVTIVGGEEPHRPHYKSRVHLARQLAVAPTDNLAPLSETTPMSISVDEAYRSWLFHGPLFQGITQVTTLAPAGALAMLRPSSPAACIVGAAGAAWLIDPVVVDSALQMNVLWTRQHWDMTVLPNSLAAYRRFAALGDGSLPDDTLRHELRIGPETRAPFVRADHYFYAADGRLLGLLMGMEGTGSPALNRLAASSRQ